jgi:hypothetical protein
MLPQQLPQQRIRLVHAMPTIEPLPHVEFDMSNWAGLPKGMGRTASYLCQLEWASSPMHCLLDSFYLHRGRTHWILWSKSYDDNWGKWEEGQAIARCAVTGLVQRDAAMILLAEYLDMRRRDAYLDRFDWINETGLLSVGEIDAVADAVWDRQVD